MNAPRDRIPCIGCGALLPDVDVLQAKGLAEHGSSVWRWARSAREAWAPHHETIRPWAEGHDG